MFFVQDVQADWTLTDDWLHVKGSDLYIDESALVFDELNRIFLEKELFNSLLLNNSTISLWQYRCENGKVTERRRRWRINYESLFGIDSTSQLQQGEWRPYERSIEFPIRPKRHDDICARMLELSVDK